MYSVNSKNIISIYIMFKYKNTIIIVFHLFLLLFTSLIKLYKYLDNTSYYSQYSGIEAKNQTLHT